jgi:hypothetical protein
VNWLHSIGRTRATVFHIDGKVWTKQSAQSAVDAMGIVRQLRGMVALRVGSFGHDEHVLGAELDAKAASLASLVDNAHDAIGYLDAVAIQRLSPVGHGPPSILC